MCKECGQLVVVGTIELVAEELGLASVTGHEPALMDSGLMGRYAASRVVAWLVEEGGGDQDHSALVAVLGNPRVVWT